MCACVLRSSVVRPVHLALAVKQKERGIDLLLVMRIRNASRAMLIEIFYVNAWASLWWKIDDRRWQSLSLGDRFLVFRLSLSLPTSHLSNGEHMSYWCDPMNTNDAIRRPSCLFSVLEHFLIWLNSGGKVLRRFDDKKPSIIEWRCHLRDAFFLSLQ